VAVVYCISELPSADRSQKEEAEKRENETEERVEGGGAKRRHRTLESIIPSPQKH
jgi:hypothetical protein